MKPTEVARTVLSWLRLQQNWLLVFDNLDDVSVADGFLPAMDKGGHTLITTRNPDAKRIPAEGFQIPLLSENDAVELLFRRSDIDFSFHKNDALEIDSEFDLAIDQAAVSERVNFSSYKSVSVEIVNELGHLALAIDHAVAFIRSLGDINKFLPIYRQSRKRVLQRASTSKYILIRLPLPFCYRSRKPRK